MTSQDLATVTAIPETTATAAAPGEQEGPQAASPKLGVGSSAVFASRSVSMVLGLFSSVLLARSLGPKSFGAFAVALSFAQLGYLLADVQLNALFLREAARAPEAEHSLIRWIRGTRFVLGLVVFVPLSLVVASVVHEHEAVVGALLILATVPLNAFTTSLAIFQRRLQLLRVSAAYVFQSVLWLAGILILEQVWKNPSITAFGAMFLATTVVYMAVISWMSRIRPPTIRSQVGRVEFFGLLRHAAPMGLGVIMVAAYYRLDSYLVFRWAGAASAADYSIAYKFLDQAQIIPSVIAMTFLPLATAADARREGLGTLFRRYSQLTIWLTGAAVTVGLMLAGPVVNVLYGSDYAGTVSLMRVLLLAIVPISLAYLVTQLALVAGRSVLQMVVYGCGLVVTVGLDSVLIPRWGAAGAAFATVVTETVVAGIFFARLRGPLGLKFPVRFAAQVVAALLLGSTLGILTGSPVVLRPVILGVTYLALSWRWRLLPIEPERLRLRALCLWRTKSDRTAGER